jgi:stress-induced morphogen
VHIGSGSLRFVEFGLAIGIVSAVIIASGSFCAVKFGLTIGIISAAILDERKFSIFVDNGIDSLVGPGISVDEDFSSSPSDLKQNLEGSDIATVVFVEISVLIEEVEGGFDEKFTVDIVSAAFSGVSCISNNSSAVYSSVSSVLTTTFDRSVGVNCGETCASVFGIKVGVTCEATDELDSVCTLDVCGLDSLDCSVLITKTLGFGNAFFAKQAGGGSNNVGMASSFNMYLLP